MKDRIMVVSPHPDDETLGCGGTLLKLRSQGHEMLWVIVTSMFEKDGFSAERVKSRENEIESVAGSYGFDRVYKLGFSTTWLDTLPMKSIIDKLSQAIDDRRPSTLFIPNRNDIHSDHRIVFNASISSAKTFRATYVKNIYMYEVLSETDCVPGASKVPFIPNSFSNITAYVNKKIRIMGRYKGEMRKHPFHRSADAIKALACLRGAIANYRYAEAFEKVRESW